ncbi:MAG: DNA mismatch repair endonuclease MutL [Crocinitomicaceae bacterium]|nr:DNA mismatch repair endonuclease MutL [Crocinitomicaceae bacterium]
MSDIIRLLPDHIANQIAAGEVIQRPASVVKELMENAIDADATRIEVHIKHAGRTLIQLIDNGKGMSDSDARMAFERHATSKVSSIDDLFSLQTKGFRGEALASVAAIAHVELNTKQENKEIGTRLEIEGSKVISQEPITCKQGASFAIKNLFYNVPARRNFLKSDVIEFKHIEEEFIRVTLAHPEIDFVLNHNDIVQYNLTGSNLRKRIVDLFGKNINDKLVPIEEQTGIVKISGFIGKPEAAKKSRGEQYLFVNNRFFKDNYFNHAIQSAYENLLAPKTFASYFLFFEIDPSSIDVNVHPTKTEIKFEEDKEIYAILKSAIRQGLGKFNIAPTLDFEQETSFELPYAAYSQPLVAPSITVNPDYNPFHSTSSSTSFPNKSIGNGNSAAMKKAGFGNENFQSQDWKNFYTTDAIPEETSNNIEQITFDSEIAHQKQYLFKGNYLISTTMSGFLIIHVKRAQERILYEQIMSTFIYNAIPSQQLLFPIIHTSTNGTLELWESNRTTIERMGFTWEQKEMQLEITGIPVSLDEQSAQNAIDLIGSKMIEETIDKGEIAHEIALSISKAKSNTNFQFSQETATYLTETLFSLPEHQFSPSGKRILQNLPLNDISNLF